MKPIRNFRTKRFSIYKEYCCVFSLLLLLTITNISFAQNPTQKQKTELEFKLFKNHLNTEFYFMITPEYHRGRFMFNYERTFKLKSSLLNCRVGYWPSVESQAFIIPVTVQFLKGNQHYFEFGGGIFISFDYDMYYFREEINTSYYPGINAGYRYQKNGNRLYYRAAANIVYGEPEGLVFIPLMTLTVGISFNL